MEVYLVQHGEAKYKEEDPERPLTEKGKQEVEKVAKHLAQKSMQVSEIRHSTKLRAKQTAEIFAKHLQAKISEMQGIAPMDDPKIAKQAIEQADAIMLVGHLPHLSNLVSLLVGSVAVAFRKGGVVCMTKEEGWQVKWIITPDIL